MALDLSQYGLLLQREHPLHEPPFYYLDTSSGEGREETGKEFMRYLHEHDIDPLWEGRGAKSKALSDVRGWLRDWERERRNDAVGAAVSEGNV